ncbi:MAG: radical SAM protein, partial [Clostridia bacterium]|nr:radical SAM protein [Clostridia bacterium]
MKISKKDALMWFSFFAALPEDELLSPRQSEIALAAFAQIEAAVDRINDGIMSDIKGLKSPGGRTYYVGEDASFPAGCRSCLFGTGLGAVRKTNRCNANCKFCYDYGQLDSVPPIGEGLWEIGGTKFYEKDIETLLTIQGKPTGLAYVYLEPFCEIEKYYNVIGIFAKAGVHQHMYTNGIAANAENLKALGDAGLDELRFNLGATNCSDKVIDNIAIAKKYIPSVGIETPMTPSFYDAFLVKKEKIFAAGADFMNCAELHLNANNIVNYEGENLYMCRQGYISPVWSRTLTLKLMQQADRENWPMLLHDCSNRTKFMRGLNLRAKEGGWFGAGDYSCEFDTIPYWAF